MTATIFVDGEHGTTGLEIMRRLAALRDIELIRLSQSDRKDFSARQQALAAADIAILCLPDAAARQAAAMAAECGTRLIDASTAHRVSEDWVYGFAEMTVGQRAAIAEARLVSNPGCYPTGAIALIRPLREAGVIAADQPIMINALSGYSGGGKALIAEFDQASAPPAFIYATAQTHKHLPELQHYGLLDTPPIFVPSVGKFAQGMIVQMPLFLRGLAKPTSLQALHDILKAHYGDGGAVSVAPLVEDPGRIDPTMLNGTDEMTLFVAGSDVKGQAILIAVLDNLGKGASGAAMQNLEIMMGSDD